MQLETDRLVLREFVQSDWQHLAVYRADPEFGRFYAPGAVTEQRARDLLAAFISWQSEKPRRYYQLAITLKENGTLIGSAGLRCRLLIGRLLELDPLAVPDEADLGYELDRQWWGQGYATEASAGLLRFGFEELSLHRIWAWCLAENRGSVAVLERLGMSREALFRSAENLQDGWADVAVYATLRDQWRQAIPAN